ncbi:hypothetical protein SSX86_026579 [Deinandra increscens subsp. villosa]|uniref:F-box domain-containing protein n=1 Tax=Deinandra increscens subsp. villosa TaxID=3103831 RepID=A0AAP0CF44_9ASTR
MADYIPFAIQEEIMKRLPTKSLMRFRSVSKSYKYLIDSSKFIVDYSFNHTHQKHLLVSYFDTKTFEPKYVSFVDDDDTFPREKCFLPVPVPVPRSPSLFYQPTIIGSSQGLFCLNINIKNSRKNAKKVVLWNPSIRKSVALVVPDNLDQVHDVITIGFGVCPYSRDPKLVKINYCKKHYPKSKFFTPWRVEVYTLSSGSWRSIPTVTQPRKSIFLRSEQVVTDEFIYWLATDGISYRKRTWDFEGYNMVVSFELASEKFMEVSLPDTLARAYNDKIAISKLKRSLVVVEVFKEANKEVFVVWMMKRNTFTKLLVINSPDASIQGVRGFWNYIEPTPRMISPDKPIFEKGTHISVQELNSEHIIYTGVIVNGLEYGAHSYTETLLLLDY